MEGKQKLFYLPEAHTDFIFAVVGEELGLIGTCVVLAAVRRFPVARPSRVELRARICLVSIWRLGITMMVCVQAFINMSVVLGFVADKGNSVAVSELWREFVCGDAGGGRHSAERFAAVELENRWIVESSTVTEVEISP